MNFTSYIWNVWAPAFPTWAIFTRAIRKTTSNWAEKSGNDVFSLVHADIGVSLQRSREDNKWAVGYEGLKLHGDF